MQKRMLMLGVLRLRLVVEKLSLRGRGNTWCYPTGEIMKKKKVVIGCYSWRRAGWLISCLRFKEVWAERKSVELLKACKVKTQHFQSEF